MTKRPAKGKVKSLEELLDWGSGELRDNVTTFLDAADVGRLAMTSKRCRTTLEDKNSGKLRATNLELLFGFKAGHDDEGRMVAKPCNLSPIYNRIDVQRLERLQIIICYDIVLDGAKRRVAADDIGDDGRGRIIDITPILAAVQSLLVISSGLTAFELSFDRLPGELYPRPAPRVFVSCEYSQGGMPKPAFSGDEVS
eukprot:g4537.t1